MPPALSRISEDSRTSHRKYVNIAGIEEYPDLVGECQTERKFKKQKQCYSLNLVFVSEFLQNLACTLNIYGEMFLTYTLNVT